MGRFRVKCLKDYFSTINRCHQRDLAVSSHLLDRGSLLAYRYVLRDLGYLQGDDALIAISFSASHSTYWNSHGMSAFRSSCEGFRNPIATCQLRCGCHHLSHTRSRVCLSLGGCQNKSSSHFFRLFYNLLLKFQSDYAFPTMVLSFGTPDANLRLCIRHIE